LDKKLTDSGAKAYQRSDTENRILPYYNWHRTLDRTLLMVDVDSIEWRIRNGEPIPVGVMEVTRVDNGKEVNPGYLQAIISRFEQRDFQAKAARKLAKMLNCKVHIVLFREDCTQFWVYNLSDKTGWTFYEPQEMERFLKSL